MLTILAVSFTFHDFQIHYFYLRRVYSMKLFFLPCLLLFPFLIRGQVSYYRELTSQNGLPTDCVFDLASDRNGLMYLGTDQGVYSYNGIDFKQIELKDAVSSSVTSISFTDNNVLWCRNFSDQVFSSYGNVLKPNKQVNSYLNNEIIVDLKVVKGKLYLLSFDAVYIIDATSSKLLKRFAIKQAEGLSIQDEMVLITTVNGYCIWLKGIQKVSSMQLAPGQYRSAGVGSSTFFIEKKKVPSLAYQVNGKSVSKILSIDKIKAGLYVNNCNIINGGVFLSTNQGTFYQQKSIWKQLSTGHNHTDVLTDFQGGIWISTIDNGLIYLPSLNITSFYSAQYGNNLRQMIASPKGYFVSTANGIVYELNRKGDLIRQFDTKTGLDIEFIYFDQLSNRLYTSVGYFNYEKTTQFFPFYYGKGIAIDAYSNLYFGIHSLSGVIKGKRKSNLFFSNHSELTVGGLSFQVIREKRTRCISLAMEQLYIGYVDQLLAYSSTETVELKSNDGKSIQAVSLALDDFGRLWIATVQDGVYVFKNGKEVKHFRADSGLSHDQCKKVKIFGNQAFIITISGLDQINVQSFKLRSFINNYSLYNTPVIDVISEEGNMMLVTKNQIIRIPHQNENDITMPKIEFKKISYKNGESQWIESRNNLLENSFEISWDYLAYREGVKVPLYYRLIGFEEKWMKLSPTVNSVSYNGLPPGDYCFELKTGLRNNVNNKIRLHIEKPYWLSWWFFAIEILVVGVLFYLTIRLTVFQMRKKQLIREQLIHSKLTAIRSQMNPHFLYNVLNSLQGLIYSNKVNEAGNYVSMFSEHLRYTLAISDKQMITIKEEIKSLGVYLSLEKLRFGEDFKFNIQRDPDVNELFNIPAMILQPFVENAVKHGLLNKKGEKTVHVHFTMNTPEVIQITIRDNGIGRQKSFLLNKTRKDKPTSFATGAIKKRIDLLNQYLNKKIHLNFVDLTENGIAVGTEVHIKIPKNIEMYESIDR